MAQHSILFDISVEELDREPGYWCHACALPSGWRLIFAVRIVARLRLQIHYHCDECDSGAHVERVRT